uniref:Ig-like domain-containing protein n=2 Tax=Equus TaxID=9789 RepID=A0A5F5PGU5_HORSE
MLLLLISVQGMIFALRDARAQSVTQPDGHVLVSEGSSLDLRCSYSYGATPYLFWYVQYPRQGLQLLLKHLSGQDTRVPGIKGFEAEFRKSNSSFNLRKSSAHWSDSAEYFCALSDTVPGSAGGAEHKPLTEWSFQKLKILPCHIFNDLLLHDGKEV